MLTRTFLLIILLFSSLLAAAQFQQEADVILERYKKYLNLTDTVRTGIESLPPVQQNGRWSDINYTDTKSGRWGLSDHLSRIRRLSVEYSSANSSWYKNDSLKNSIDLALTDWFSHQYQSRNWWHNEIGIPQIMRDIIILLQDELSEKQRINALKILNQHKVKGTGANLIWSADLGLHYALLTGDSLLAVTCRDTILTVIQVTTEEGVQPDYSFHQHGKRLQMYHYGGAFLLEDVRLAWQLRETSLAFPSSKIAILTDFLLQGWQWMARGIHTVPGTIDRAASRKDALHSADIRNILPLMYDILPDSIAAFRRMLESQQGDFSLSGYRYYPFSDFTAYHHKAFSFLLKTVSDRTLLTEAINEENLKGDLLNMGDGYFIRDGSEYFNLMPFWDWQRLPGITSFESAGKKVIHRNEFVGNSGDNNSGFAVMNYALSDQEQQLSVNKFWASWNNLTVVLVAGLDDKNLNTAAFSVMDQSRWQSAVHVAGRRKKLDAGHYHFDSRKWIHHHEFVYIPLYNDRVQLELKQVDAEWYSINHSESKETIQDNIFLPSLLHNSGHSGYVVAHVPELSKVKKLVRRPTWKILRNDSLAQAVRFKDGQLMAALYTSGEHQLDEHMSIHLSLPALLHIRDKQLYIADPAHNGGNVQLTINGIQYNAVLSSTGTATMIQL